MSSIADSVTLELNILAFYVGCDTRAVADLVARVIRERKCVDQRTGRAGTLLQRLEAVLGAVHTRIQIPPGFSESVQDAMQAVASNVVSLGLNAREITRGAILGVLHAARDCGLPEHIALAAASLALIDHTDRIAGDLAGTAHGIVEGATEDARLSHRHVPSAELAVIRTVAESASECDADAVEGARSMREEINQEKA